MDEIASYLFGKLGPRGNLHGSEYARARVRAAEAINNAQQ